MITIFTVPRPFTGHFGVIQRNAVRSWRLLEPQPQVLLFERITLETQRAAQELGVVLLPVACNPHGTPLITDALRIAQGLAMYDILCMANADNIYLSDLPPAVEFVAGQFEQFLAIGRRWNLAVTEPLEFGEGWEDDLRKGALEQDDIEHAGAVDYLIWRGDFYRDLPPLAVGQKGYDWLLVWLANEAGVPVVDIGRAVTVIHQDHPATFRSAETELNDRLITERYGDGVRGGLGYASHRLFSDRLEDRATGEAVPWER